MKKLLLFLLLGSSVWAQESENEPKDYGRVYGGFESNSQWYLNDEGRQIDQPEDPIRSNNYLFVNYQYKKWSTGVQVEGYEKNALLNYNPLLKGTDVATYFVAYKTDKIQFTAGHFYEQFGSGLLFRSWEDRALGINTALRGGRIIYNPIDAINIKLIAGQQRSGFDVSDGKIFGFDTEINLTEWLKWETSDLSIGGSYVGRYEKLDNPAFDIDPMTNTIAGRFNFIHDSFYMSGEYNHKAEDAIVNLQGDLVPDFIKDGSAILLNMGYSKSGLGIDLTLRRLENFSFLSEREPTVFGENTSLNFNDKIINFTPALTKQHHSNLANIYVFQAQNRVDFIRGEIMKAGETGGQIDIFYDIKKETALGGKYGTKVAVNLSSWYNLPGDYRLTPPDYETNFFGAGKKYFSDYNIEIKKKLTEDWRSAFNYVRQYYNKTWIEGGHEVNTHIINGEAVYNFNTTRSIRFEAEHMWADADFKNWAGGTVEMNWNEKLSFYVWDIINYGNDNSKKRNHYYNFGGAYRFGSSRIAMNYGRQRGGLVCVGGVCRFVPESTGFSLSLNTAF
uniref:DUF6029 family protein n=1 Tax=Flavobacterium sp. TaxID=239 RepID=UPI004049DC13